MEIKLVFPVNWKYVEEMRTFIRKYSDFKKPFLVIDEDWVYFVGPWCAVRVRKGEDVGSVSVGAYNIREVCNKGKKSVSLDIKEEEGMDGYIRNVQRLFERVRQRDNERYIEIKVEPCLRSNKCQDQYDWFGIVSSLNYKLVKKMDALVNFMLLEKFVKLLFHISCSVGELEMDVLWNRNIFDPVWFKGKKEWVEGLVMGLWEAE